MLLKLMKHEFRATGRIMLPVLAAVVGLSVMAGISIRVLDHMENLSWVIDAMLGLLIFAFFLSMFAAVVVAFVLMIQRYYRSLLGNEGYLSMTLPVSIDAHLWNKLLTSTIWFVVVGLICAAAMTVVLAILNPEALGLQELFRGIALVFKEIGTGHSILLCVELLLLTVAGCFAACLKFYAAMAIGQSASSKKILVSVLVYFLLGAAQSIIGVGSLPAIFNESVVRAVFGRFDMTTVTGIMSAVHTGFTAMFIYSAIGCVILYFLTRIFMTKKLNLA